MLLTSTISVAAPEKKMTPTRVATKMKTRSITLKHLKEKRDRERDNETGKVMD